MAKNNKYSQRAGKSALGMGLFLKCSRPGLETWIFAEESLYFRNRDNMAK
jgi:hypothetical protein